MKKRHLGILLRLVLAIAVAAILVLAGRALLVRKRRALAQAPNFELAASPVETAEAYIGDLAEAHEYLAVVEPRRRANVSARITAMIERVPVREGDPVKAGDVLVKLDDRQFQDDLATMKAQIAQAEAELAANQINVASLKKTGAYWEEEAKRDQKLATSGTIPQAQSDATAEKANEARGKLLSAEKKSVVLKQQVLTLQRKTDELRTILGYATIVSPFAGIVTVKTVDPGDMATPGKVLVTVEDRSFVKLGFDVPQSDLPTFQAGLPATFDVNGKTAAAKVKRVYPALNRARMVRAEIELPPAEAQGLPMGGYVEVAVAFRRFEQVPLIPVEALIETVAGGYQVFLVEDGVLHARSIQVKGTACELAAVDGIQAGDTVVVNSFLGWARLADGMNVELR